MKRSVETTLAWGGLFKNIVMGLGSLLILGIAIWNLTEGRWVAFLVIVFIVEPIWFVVADIATGLLLIPVTGIAHMFGKD